MATANQVSQLFVALYNRAIDGVTAQTYAGRSYNQSFISEVIGLTPNLRTMTNQEFVELVYKNALGKDNNSDKEGIDYWVSQANENNWRREQLTDNLLRSINAWADQNADTTGLSQEKITLASQGATVFRTKVAIAEQAATTVGGQADTYALTFGSGLEDVTINNYNTTRENNSKILQAIAARNPLAQSGGATVALGLNPDTGEGQENFLAPGDPNIPEAASGSTYVYKTSTDFDDVVTGTVAAVDPTFTGDAQIDAGKGNDTLKLSMSTSFTGLSGDGRVTGVERIELTNTTVNDNVTFNASGIRDVYTYVLNGANGINLTNVAYNEYLLIEMNNIKSTGNTTGSSGAATVQNGGVTQITFDTTPTGGRLDLNFNSVGYDSTDNSISNHDILFGIGSGTAIDPNGSADDFANQAAGIGILNIALTGNNYADIVNNGVNRITVGGNGSLTTNLSQGVTYFNGTNATGALNVTALAPKEIGENGTNIFEYFATGSADDKVHIAVERLGQNASVNLGLGNDTLTLSGQVDHEARKQFYNFNTIENLVFGELTGDALLIDLGTTVVTTPQDPIISGSGSKKTEIPQPDIVTTTQDRSANLQTITFEDGASVQLTSLGKKDLKVTYNGTQDDQKVLVDTEGTVNLVLQGSDAGASGTGVKGGGFVNLSNAKAVNVDLTGQGFEGFLSAGNAVDLNINNYTGDKKLKLKANTATEKNDLSSVVNLTIDTEAQDINASGASSTAHSVDIENADLASIKAITLKGTGGVKLGELANKEGITIAGANYSGRLDTGNIYAGPGPLSITTKGAITTGNLTGNNITIDLSKNITTTEGEYNNNIGTIYVERVDATNSSGTLTYTTGISGTQGKEFTNPDGSLNAGDTQKIVVNTNSATLNINGAGGVDKFDIEASSFTKTLTIAGNLGTVPNYEEANNNYDTVRIDLSKTSGVNLDISRLLVSNPNDEGIQITASKGQDNITLTAGANHDVIEFTAGGGASAVNETYEVDLGNLRLGKNQSFTIDGLTITNVKATATILTAADVAEIIKAYGSAAGNVTATTKFTLATAGTTGSSVNVLDYVNFSGKLESLTGAWLSDSGAATYAHEYKSSKLTITAANSGNLADLNMTFDGISNADVPDSFKAEYTKARSAGFAMVQGATASGGSVDTFTVNDIATAGTSFLTITIGSDNHTIKIVNTSTTSGVTAGTYASEIVDILTGASTVPTTAGLEYFVDGSSSKLTAATTAFNLGNDWVWMANGSTKVTIVNNNPFASGDAQHVIINQITGASAAGSVDFSLLPNADTATQGNIVIDFGQGLLAGQSYTFNGKSVVATKDLTGAEVAEAFTFGAGENFDGAAIVGTWSSNINDSKILFGIDGSKLTILDNTGTAFSNSVETDITGTGALAVNTNRVTGTTTKQGQGSGEVTFADSYVVFASSDKGSAAAGSADGVAANIKAVTGALDTITNFDIANDKLLLNKFDILGATTAKYVASDAQSITAGSTGIYVDAAGNELSVASAGVGIIGFSAGNAEASAITLDQKLFAASELMTTAGGIAGFEHGGDFYVIAAGTDTQSTTDDLVIKLAGVTGITDIGAVLA